MHLFLSAAHSSGNVLLISARTQIARSRRANFFSNWSMPAPMPPFAGASRGKPVTYICAEVHLVEAQHTESPRVLMSGRDAASRLRDRL